MSCEIHWIRSTFDIRHPDPLHPGVRAAASDANALSRLVPKGDGRGGPTEEVHSVA
jgi:hypothetical protein